MSFEGADIPFVGGAYEAPDLLQDCQRLINWYCEVGGPNAKEPIALLATPGLSSLFTGGTFVTGPVRGCWVLPGGTQALVVVANTVYVMTLTVPATQTSIAKFSVASVGTLLTNSGYVCIRDNGTLFGGLGGYAVLVDGTYGYYYSISGARTISFTGAVTSGSNLISLSGPIPGGLIASTACTLTDTGSAVTGFSITGFNFNSQQIQLSANATGTVPSDTFTLNVSAFGQINDTAFLGANRVAFIEGWLIFNQPGTRTFYTNAATPYTLQFAGSFYALKDSSTDNLITLYEQQRELWLIGERTSEVWYNAGGANFAFSRLPGVGPQIGCAAVNSITRMGSSLVWLAKNEQGENVVVATNQYTWERFSTHAIEHAIASYPLVSDAIGYSYQEEGHLFYVLTFPTADVTWVYDATSQLWHQRLSFDSATGTYHRHRSNCYMDFADLRIVGDYQSGQVYQMARGIYTDAGNVIRRQRRTPHVWSRDNRKRVFFSSIQVEFTPGVGLQVGQGVNPQAMLRWSNDGGFTWSNEHWTTIGAAGATRNRAIWRRLGQARDRVYELNFSDPVAADIVGATLFGEAEAAA